MAEAEIFQVGAVGVGPQGEIMTHRRVGNTIPGITVFIIPNFTVFIFVFIKYLQGDLGTGNLLSFL